MALNFAEVKSALEAANAAPFGSSPACGCGRAYVVVSAPKEEVKMVEAACKAMGLMFLKRAYGTSGNAIYIGYDNADGRALAKSHAFAKVLNERGIRCHSDAVED